MGYNLRFIKQEDFEKHVENTLNQYRDTLKSMNLKEFNKNIIDPIKLLFDKNVMQESFEKLINMEIYRQRDKTNTNAIGYFHQNMFKYIKNCEVPNSGWDIIYKSPNTNNIYYVEMKNKHNTMNSSSASKTFMRMQNHLLNSEDRENSICALVEVIAKQSQNIPWVVTLDKEKQQSNERLRRISIDKFYEIVTGEKYAFRDMCLQLPKTIEKIIEANESLQIENDTVLKELNNLGKDKSIALYKLAFETYEGFNFL
ncbi:MAG TPA: Eco47II family restriction endonuclease [Clostridiales bacterium]|mgnify:CR=1 FL=1|nr:Eco47II family restriction endonuclease [Clostridiales bacterium]